jgi:hypothetical protein
MKARKQIAADPLELDEQTSVFWKSLSNNPLFHKLLEHLDTQRGEYSEEKLPSQHPHIQSERNGGIKAWNKLATLLLNPTK